MENGRNVEFDHPYILLQNENGKFTSMVKRNKQIGGDFYEIAKKVFIFIYIFFFFSPV